MKRLAWRLSLLLVSLMLSSPSPGAEPVETTAQARLFEQLHFGEARGNPALVEWALARLTAIAPDSPRVLEARVRQALREQSIQHAEALIQRLAERAPDSEELARARSNLHVSTPQGQAELAQARLLATAGQLEVARQAYDRLFRHDPPTLELAVEYWELIGRLAGGRERAIEALTSLKARYPGHPPLRFTLVRLLLAADRRDEALQLLAQLGERPDLREEAARQWRNALQGAPTSPATVRAWEDFLAHFGDTPYAEEARRRLTRDRQRLADPDFQARRRGLATLATDDGTAAAADLEQALKAFPDDVEVLGGLGIMRMRQGRHGEALALVQRAQRLDTDGLDADKWRDLITAARYWQQIGRGDRALADDRITQAEMAYRAASGLDPSIPAAWLGLGDAARTGQAPSRAESAYRRAMRLAPQEAVAPRRLAELFAETSPEGALAFLDGLSSGLQRQLTDLHDRLRLMQLRQRAGHHAEQGDWRAAEASYREARALAPNDVWLAYGLAQVLRRLERQSEGQGLLDALVARLDDPEQLAQGRHAQALLLVSADRIAEALEVLAWIPPARQDDDIRTLVEELERRETLERALALRDAGREGAAIALLERLPAHPDVSLILGDWALAREDLEVAETQYRLALSHDRATLATPRQQDAARLGLIETLAARGASASARRELEQMANPDADLETGRRTANLWARLGDTARADALFTRLLARPEASRAPQLYRDAARLSQARHDSDKALSRYRQGLIAAGLAPREALQDDARLTRATRLSSSAQKMPEVTPAWLADSLKRETAELYRRQRAEVGVGRLVQNDGGTDGVSSLTTTTDMLEIDTPMGEGRGFVRLDRVTLEAGRLERDADGLNHDVFGTCASVGCGDDLTQQDGGISVGVGWYDETWRLDIGTTPLGFLIQDWVGGIGHSTTLGPLWLDLDLSRRPMTDSLLSYAGARDPNTGMRWGGIRATGLRLGLGHDQGGDIGAWSSLDLHRLSGENVSDNDRLRLLGGLYHRWLDEPDRQINVGINAMAMHHEHNLGGYSLGQGGYYSPRRYLSLSLPVGYRQRTANWSWALEASVSHSWTESGDQSRYPLGGRAIAALPDADERSSSSRGGGVGFAASARIEHRLSDHWRTGLAFDLQESEGYSPDALQVYLRYTPSAWQGDLNQPPAPLSPYADMN